MPRGIGEGKIEMRNVSCILCLKKAVLINEKNIYKCSNCDLEFVYPMPLEKELEDFYEYYFNPRAREDVTKINAEKNIDYLRGIYGLNKEHKLLDFGCGDNVFIKVGDSKNWIGYDKYKSSKILEGNYDFITLFGVLEHLVNPLETIKNLFKLLDKNGKIIITTVGETETGIPYQYKVPEHLTFWNKKSIEELFNQAGLKLKEFSPYRMYQDKDIFLDIIARVTKLEPQTRKMLYLNLPKGEKYIELPTNEMFVVGEK